jgi:hypothetical protein
VPKSSTDSSRITAATEQVAHRARSPSDFLAGPAEHRAWQIIWRRYLSKAAFTYFEPPKPMDKRPGQSQTVVLMIHEHL